MMSDYDDSYAAGMTIAKTTRQVFVAELRGSPELAEQLRATYRRTYPEHGLSFNGWLLSILTGWLETHNSIPYGELQRLSRLTGRSVSHLSRILRGERQPSPELAEALRWLEQSQGPEDAHPGP